MDWSEIKKEAKEKIKGKLWDVWKPALIIGIISMIISALSSAAFGQDSSMASMIVSLFSLLLVPAEIGMTSYILKLVRGEDYSLDELKAFYPKIGIIIGIEIVTSILIILGFIALVIPGIILAFGYSMVNYIFVDNTDLELTEYLKKSREMMKGYKFNYFAFSFSFIGWILLCFLVFPMIWVIPYIDASMALYYDKLKEVKKEEICYHLQS